MHSGLLNTKSRYLLYTQALLARILRNNNISLSVNNIIDSLRSARTDPCPQQLYYVSGYDNYR